LRAAFTDGAGGPVFAWREGLALEDELFMSLSDDAVAALLDKAIELKEEALIDEHIKSASDNAKDLNDIQGEALFDGISEENRAVLCKAAKSGKGWFKTVSAMELAAREVIGPDLPNADADFEAVIDGLFGWATDGGQ
jgi:hypothetical protein